MDNNPINIQSAELNATEQNVSNVTFHTSSCSSFCESILPTLQSPITVIVDPPKEGCHKKVMQYSSIVVWM